MLVTSQTWVCCFAEGVGIYRQMKISWSN